MNWNRDHAENIKLIKLVGEKKSLVKEYSLPLQDESKMMYFCAPEKSTAKDINRHIDGAQVWLSVELIISVRHVLVGKNTK